MKKILLSLLLSMSLLLYPFQSEALSIDFSALNEIVFDNEEISDVYLNGELVWSSFKEPFYVIKDGLLIEGNYTETLLDAWGSLHTAMYPSYGRGAVCVGVNGTVSVTVDFETNGARLLDIDCYGDGGWRGANGYGAYKGLLRITADDGQTLILSEQFDVTSNTLKQKTVDIKGYDKISVECRCWCSTYSDTTNISAWFSSIYCHK